MTAPSRSRENSARYSREHRARVGHGASRKWQAANPDKVRARDRTRSLSRRFRRYGVTSDWFRDQLVGQAGRCAICTNVMQPGKGTHIDHDHATGVNRGLLCTSCNLMLGMAKDSALILKAAMRYLGGENECQPV